jgi:hypothetical protein
MALTVSGERPLYTASNPDPVTVGVSEHIDVPRPLVPAVGYMITWSMPLCTAGDYVSFNAAMADGRTIDLGDCTTGWGEGPLFVRGALDTVTCIPHFDLASIGEVTFTVTEVTAVPDMQSIRRRATVVTATPSPVVITLPSGTMDSQHEWYFTLYGTWTAGTITPTETEPGGFTTSFGAIGADYRSARRIGPVSGFEMVLAAINSVGIYFTSYHTVPVM